MSASWDMLLTVGKAYWKSATWQRTSTLPICGMYPLSPKCCSSHCMSLVVMAALTLICTVYLRGMAVDASQRVHLQLALQRTKPCTTAGVCSCRLPSWQHLHSSASRSPAPISRLHRVDLHFDMQMGVTFCWRGHPPSG